MSAGTSSDVGGQPLAGDRHPPGDFAGHRVLIDGQNLALPRGTGIATYSRQLVAALRSMGMGVDVAIASAFSPSAVDAARNRRQFDLAAGGVLDPVFSAEARSYLRGLLAKPNGLRLGAVDMDPSSGMAGALARLRLADRCFVGQNLFDAARQHAIRWGKMMPLHITGDRPDLFHAMQIAPMKVPGKPCIVTIHDIIPLVLPGSTTENLRHFRQVVEAILRDADHIITVSEHSRQDLVRFLKADERRITNTYQTVQLSQSLVARSESELDDDLAFYDLEPGEYFMFLGSIEPKKNVRRLVEAFAGSGTNRQLIIVGGLGWDFDEDVRAIEDEAFVRYRRRAGYLQKTRQVRRLSYVPQAQVISLLRGARGLLFPSLYEGFGLPVAEALALGTPVMTSNASSLPEVAGDAALMVEPEDTLAMAKAIRKLDNDADLRAELSRRGPLQVARFSPTAHQERLEAVYRAVL